MRAGEELELVMSPIVAKREVERRAEDSGGGGKAAARQAQHLTDGRREAGEALVL